MQNSWIEKNITLTKIRIPIGRDSNNVDTLKTDICFENACSENYSPNSVTENNSPLAKLRVSVY